MKSLVIFAGVNGAGKTTVYGYLQSRLSSSVRLNADEVLASGEASSEFEAMKKVHRGIYSCLERGVDFHLETTLAGVGKTHLRYIQLAKSKGYRVSLVYVTLATPELAVSRVAKRVSLGGHHIESSTVHRRFYSSLRNFYEVLPFVDYLEVYENSISMQGIYNGHPSLFKGSSTDELLQSRLN